LSSPISAVKIDEFCKISAVFDVFSPTLRQFPRRFLIFRNYWRAWAVEGWGLNREVRVWVAEISAIIGEVLERGRAVEAAEFSLVPRGVCSAVTLGDFVGFAMGFEKFGGENVELTGFSGMREMITCSLGCCFVSPSVGMYDGESMLREACEGGCGGCSFSFDCLTFCSHFAASESGAGVDVGVGAAGSFVVGRGTFFGRCGFSRSEEEEARWRVGTEEVDGRDVSAEGWEASFGRDCTRFRTDIFS
jgi:hypothetical protein